MITGGRVGRLLGPVAAVVATAGCAGESSTGPRPIVGTVALAPGQYALYAGAQAAGPLEVPAADSAGARYLVVAQFATGVGDIGAAFALAGAAPGPPTARVAAARASPPRLPLALRFHDNLRRLDDAAARASLALPPGRAPAAPAPFRGPPVLGSRRTFRVCGDVFCSGTASVSATVRVVGAHSAIYVDDSAPAQGFQTADLQRLGAQFDTALFPVDTAAFGAPSDIDANGVVLILLTPKVNALTPASECSSSYVTGYFLGADLAPATRRAYNNGEIFYGMVPDPDGSVSCRFTVARAASLIPRTFVHEFQHMISFNQHVLVRGGTTEELWLNEGLSHLAEELAGRRLLSAGDSAGAADFFFGDLYNAFEYLSDPAGQAVVTVTVPGTLEARGGAWLFARYLVDQFGPGLTRSLDQTALVGAANVQSATGAPFATLLGRWALAIFVSDLPGVTLDAALRYRSWALRTTFASLHRQDPADYEVAFPLAPESTSAGSFSLSGSVASGSGAYLLLTRPPDAAALTLSFTTPGGRSLPGSGHPQLAIVRLR